MLRTPVLFSCMCTREGSSAKESHVLNLVYSPMQGRQ